MLNFFPAPLPLKVVPYGLTTYNYRWSKDFLEAGKKRLAGDTVREASSDEVVDLKKENTDLKQAVAELYLRNDWLKKSLTGQDVTLEEG